MVLTVDHMQLNVVKTFVGDYMTSLGMAGVSLTLMNIVNTCWEQCLGKPRFQFNNVCVGVLDFC